MSRKCLKCGKGPVKQWTNMFSNYNDFKCTHCGYVWHEAFPGVSQRRSRIPRKSSRKK